MTRFLASCAAATLLITTTTTAAPQPPAGPGADRYQAIRTNDVTGLKDFGDHA